METFFSIQGEGFHSGKSAYFIRIGGCDVGCHWCDVQESWDHGNLVIITGGEPLMWDMTVLTKKIKKNKMVVHLETSGAYNLSGKWDWICLSPKKQKLPKKEIYEIANELKIIIYNKHDLEFALEESKKVSEKCKLFLQPEWDRFEKNKSLIFDFIKKNPNWNLSLQLHKFMGID